MLQFKAISPELEQKINDNLADFNIAGVMLEKYHAIPEIEIEARIIRNDIDLVIFKRIKEFMDKNEGTIKLVEETKSLDIYVMTTKTNRLNQSDKLSNLRFTLEGPDIGEYCKTDKLPKNYSLLYKSPLRWNKKVNNIAELDNYDIDTIDFNDITSSSYMDIHDIRFNAKIEIELNKNTNTFELKDNLSTPIFMKNALAKANEKLEFFKKQDFSTLFKTYRLKHRYRYLYSFNQNGDNLNDTIPNDFYIDITRVKMSKREMVGVNGETKEIPVNNFIDSEIVEQTENYEIEFEIIKKDQSGLGQTIRNIIYPFISRKLLPYAFKSPIEYIYSQKEEELIKSVYLQELNKAYNIILNYKIDVVNLLISMADHIKTIYRLKGQINTNIENSINNKLIEIYRNYNYNYYDNNIKLHSYSYYVRLISGLKKDNINTSDKLIKKLEEYKKIYENHKSRGLFDNNKNMFISPQVVTMEMNDIREDNLYGIQYNYTVTDKADGQGMLLFCFNSDQSWMNQLNLIDSNLRILPVDLKIKSVNGLYLFNGEYITSLERNKYGIFDTYFINGISYINAPLMIKDEINTRINKAIEFVNNELESDSDKMEIVVKQFILGDNDMSIWDAGNKIWNSKYEYHLDGLIYTPALEPVGYDINNKDSDLKLARTWNRNLKWKPDYENTIDCLIKFEKEIKARYNTREVLIDKIENKAELSAGGKQEIKQYKIANIYNGESNEIFTTRDNRKIYSVLKPRAFQPIIGNSMVNNRIYLPLEYDTMTGKWFIRSEDKQIVEDDTIVELIYNKENEGERYQYNWKVLRTRYDKTYLYHQGRQAQKQLYNLLQICLQADRPDENMVKKLLEYLYIPIQDDRYKKAVDKFNANKKFIMSTYKSDIDMPVDIKQGNTMRVAKNIWNSIHNPITEKNILNGEDIPDEDIYYNSSEDKVKSYSVTTVLQKFHNYVKSEILLRNAIEYCKEKMGYVYILDMTCGQGGDIDKWNSYGANRCLAIDLYDTNIDNAKNRYSGYVKSNPQFVMIDFIVGDTSKRYKTDTTNAIKSSYDREVYNSLMKNVYNKQLFNVIPFMFSIHYFFNNNESFTNVINNINDHLAVGGILLGTCFDGNRILNEYVMEFIETIQSYTDENKVKLNDLVIYKDGRLILKIKPNFLEKNINASWFKKMPPELPNDDNSLGLEIDVFIYTIEKMVTEYLVNYKYLEKELSKYNIVPLNSDEMSSMSLPMDGKKKLSIGSFDDVYNFIYKMKDEVKDVHLKRRVDYILENLSDDEFNISKLNGYFMFIKKSTKYGTVSKVIETRDKELEKLKEDFNKLIENIEKAKKEDDMKKYLKIIGEINDLNKEVKNNGTDSMQEYNKKVIIPKLKILFDEYKKLQKNK